MYTKEVERVLSVPSILNLTGDKVIYKIKAKNETTPYVVYKPYNDAPGFEAEGERKTTKYYIQIDINDKKMNFSKLKKEIYKQAKLNNWTRESGVYEDFDSNTELFFSILRFSFDLKEEI